MSDVYDPDNLFQFKNVALDVARNFGNESSQSLDRMKRLVNRAAIIISGGGRRWTWMRTMGDTIVLTPQCPEVSLDPSVKDILAIYSTGANRQKLKRIPTLEFRKYVPDPSQYTGNPYLYDYAGVDTDGSIVLSFFPTPTASLELEIDFYRQIVPIRSDEKNIRAAWGIPPQLLECLISVATALAWKGVDDTRYRVEMKDAMELIKEEYARDQHNPDTIHRAPFDDGESEEGNGDPQFPAAFGG